MDMKSTQHLSSSLPLCSAAPNGPRLALTALRHTQHPASAGIATGQRRGAAVRLVVLVVRVVGAALAFRDRGAGAGGALGLG